MIDKPRRKQGGRSGGGIATPASASQAIELRTLGQVRLRLQGEDVTHNFGAKHLALLIYLFHERRPMHPSEVIELLGRGQGEETELEGLKRSVSFLSERLPGLRIMMSPETIEALRGVWLDTVVVEDALDRDDGSVVHRAYIGDFLAGFKSGSDDFDAWADKERARIKRAWSRAILGAARAADREQDWKNAAEWWRTRIAHVPLHDEAIVGLLRAVAKAEGKNAAAIAYKEYLARLKEKGQEAPAEAVKKVVRQLRLPKKPRPPEEAAPSPEPTVIDLASEPLQEVVPPKADIDLAPEFEPQPEPEPEPTPEPEPAAHHTPQTAAIEPQPTATGDDESQEMVDVASSEEAEFLLAAMAEMSGGDDGVAQESEPMAVAQVLEASEGEVDFDDLPLEGIDIEMAAEAPIEVSEEEAAPEEIELMTAADAFADVGAPEETGEEFEIMTASDIMEDIHGGELVPDELEVISSTEPSEDLDTVLEPEGLEITPAALSDEIEVADPPSEELDLMSESDSAMLGADPRPLPDLSDLSDSGTRDLDPEPLGDFKLERPWAPKRTRRRRKKGQAEDSALFTESSFVHMAKTAQAHLSTPRLVAIYQTLIHVAATVLAAAWVGIVKGSAFLRRGLPTAFRYTGQKLKAVVGLAGRGAQAGLRGVRAGGAAAKTGLAKAGSSARAKRKKRGSAPTSAPAGAVQASAATIEPPPAPEIDHTPAADIGSAPAGIDHVPPSQFDTYPETPVPPTPAPRAQPASAPRAQPAPAPRAQRAPRVPIDFAAAGRRFRLVAVAVVAIGAVVVLGPKIVGLAGGLVGKLTSSIPAVGKPSLPEISLPKLSLPKVSVPDFGDVLAGPVLEKPGQWVLVADFSDSGAAAAEPTPSTLTAALHMDLSQARYFSVLPRERALNALRAGGSRNARGVSVEQAKALARAGGYAAILAGRVGRDTVSHFVELKVLSPSGDALYGVIEHVSDWSGIQDGFQKATLALRRKLGEPAKEIEAGLPLTAHLSKSPKAISAYAKARHQLYERRYDRAIREAQVALRHDSGFAMAYRLIADAEALRGRRARSRAAMDKAWELRDRLPERERLRLEGDRLVLEGKLTAAFNTYDGLFDRYRDDAGALRSLVIVQRMLGSRGAGSGNLRVAYSIDPYDWPSLSSIAKVLGYSGRLPSVDSLVATLQKSQ